MARSYHPHRRSILAGAGMAAAAMWLGPTALAATQQHSRRAIDIVGRSLVIDMLAPLSLTNTPDSYALPLSPAQLEDYRASGITAFHNSVGFNGPGAHAEVMAYFAAWSGFVGRDSDHFTLISLAEDLDRAKRSGKIAMIHGVQNADHFRTIEDVRTFYELGQRVSQITYNRQNLLGSGSTERVDGGVTDFGAGIIARMNEVGMLVDVSHSGDRTTLDAIEISTQPIAFTHSNCRALNNHPRLKTDEAIRKLAAKGGVMGITGVRMFVRDREPTTVEHMVDHIDHVVQLVGIEHVGIGSDSDLYGYDKMPDAANRELRSHYKTSYAFRSRLDTDGYDHPRKIFDLTEALIRRGYSDANIAAILGGNFRRLLGTVWKAPT
ncbi:MAG: membrane dipeptidase [Pseudomonadota bacterium]|uniref:dipeptidase n=1 Tax=Sphingomonas sp. ERG5 TaxID=1381597 RepID=UPI00054C23AE|nr:membrane dipeptidase [Sphingomonas sp. ERG5]